MAGHADEWNWEASPSQTAQKIGVLRTELQAESTDRTWVEQGSPFIDQERARLGAAGYRGDELEAEVRTSAGPSSCRSTRSARPSGSARTRPSA